MTVTALCSHAYVVLSEAIGILRCANSVFFYLPNWPQPPVYV